MAAQIRRGWRVLLVSDQPGWVAELLSHLEPEGYAIGVAADTATAWLVLTGEPPPELVLLDQGLPQQSALPLVSRMRQSAINVPLMLLMHQSDPPCRAQALDLGVDDCLSLPFWPGELLARLRAMLRRRWPQGAEQVPDQLLAWIDLRLNRARREAWRRNHLLPLSLTEVRLLELLMLRPGEPLSAQALREAVWGEVHAQRPDLLEVYAEHLLKIVNTSGDRPLLESHWCIREGSSPRLDALCLVKG